MKRLITITLFIVGFISSCTKDVINSDTDVKNNADEMESLKAFAKILSSAVSEQDELRSFIKVEAQKQFDKDYDVFYPWIKDNIVSGGRSFREVLLEYTSEDVLSNIEQAVPKLNIMVPDWNFIDESCFSINTWDTSDNDIAVGFDDRSTSHRLYSEGKEVGSICVGEYPTFPILIVKSNERMKESIDTKSGSASFSFADDAFNGLQTKSSYTQEWEYDKDGASDFIPNSYLNNLVTSAYEEFGTSWGNAMHRDYIYFGMTKNNTNNGEENTFITERIVRFQIEPASFFAISDSSKDPQFIDEITRWKNGNAFKGNDIQPYLWSEGSFEINFDFYWGIDQANNMKKFSKVFPVKAYELWELTKSNVKKTLRPFDGFKYRYIYSNNSINLVSKWYYPASPVDLPYWDISEQSSDIYFTISEFDDPSTNKVTISNSWKYTDNFKINANVPSGRDSSKVKVSLGLDYSLSHEHVKSSSMEITTTHTSNQMGDCNYPFDLPVVKSQQYTKNGVAGRDVNSVSSGSIKVTLIPRDKRF